MALEQVNSNRTVKVESLTEQLQIHKELMVPIRD